MNKILIGIISVLALGCFCLYLHSRNLSNRNTELISKNEVLTATLSAARETISEKIKVINDQNKKYQEIISSIKYNECENLPVSVELVEAAKELQK